MPSAWRQSLDGFILVEVCQGHRFLGSDAVHQRRWSPLQVVRGAAPFTDCNAHKGTYASRNTLGVRETHETWSRPAFRMVWCGHRSRCGGQQKDLLNIEDLRWTSAELRKDAAFLRLLHVFFWGEGDDFCFFRAILKGLSKVTICRAMYRHKAGQIP